MTTPSFKGLKPSGERASKAARGSSRKTDTKPELMLRRAVWERGLRYRLRSELAGKPDFVFQRARVVVFVDGDFWHGRDLERRLEKLRQGHNAAYWVAKVQGNVERDRRNDGALQAEGWTVIRLWETDILADPEAAADKVVSAIK